MEFNREELEELVSQKLKLAERSVVRAYLKNCCHDANEIEAAAEEFISSRAENRVQALSERLEESLKAKKELERQLADRSFELAVNKAIYSIGVKNEFCEDVKLLALHSVDEESSEDEIAQAVAAVIERIPAFAAGASDMSEAKPEFAGHKGNFARRDDSAALMQSRLNSSRASGDNARSVAIISEAAEMGILLR